MNVLIIHGVFALALATVDRGHAQEAAATSPQPTAEASAVAEPPTEAACFPPCSPGYLCDEGVCIQACNPACSDNERCSAERICVARTSPAAATTPAPTGEGTLCVFRKYNFSGSAVAWTITIDDSPVSDVRAGKESCFDVSAGEHALGILRVGFESIRAFSTKVTVADEETSTLKLRLHHGQVEVWTE